MAPAKRIYSIDMVRLIAAFFVVCIHTKTISSIDHFTINSLSFIIDNIARFAVPFFFISSGYLLDFNDKKKLFERLWSIAYMYLFWCFVFIIIRSIFHFPYPELHFANSKAVNETANVIYKLFFYGYERHLWFFTAYILAALMTYYLRNSFRLMVVLAIVFYLAGLTGQQYAFIYPQRIANVLHDNYVTRNGIFFAFPFFAAGFLVKKIKDFRLSNVVLVCLIALFFVTQYLECIYVLKTFGARPADYYLSTFFLCGALFIFCIKNTDMGKAAFKFTRLAGGVYILHPLFIYAFIILKQPFFETDWWTVAYTSILFILSLIAAAILARSALGRRLLLIS